MPALTGQSTVIHLFSSILFVVQPLFLNQTVQKIAYPNQKKTLDKYGIYDDTCIETLSQPLPIKQENLQWTFPKHLQENH